MESYIITGATGHIGNVITRKLVEQGKNVTVLVLPNDDLTPLKNLKLDIVFGDITDRDFILKFIKQDSTVLHLAGIIDIGTLKVKLVENVNVQGTKNIVDACIKNKAKKLIYLSTVHIIDPQKIGDILKEPTEFNKDKIVGTYAKTKLIATKYIFDACKTQKLNATVLYPSGVIGPYDFKISEIGQVILDYINHKLFAYVKGGYNFVDVRDVADATIKAVTKGRSGEGYIISGEAMELKGLLMTINKKLGRKKLPPKIALWFVRMMSGLSNLYYKVRNKKPVFSKYSLYTISANHNFSYEKAKKELNYAPMNIEKSIGDAVDWFIKNKPELVNCKKLNKDC
ncbi:MAG: NAD-dependent epimerase/dehydratase family protein [Clostridia bacterium]|nr:NAD-dependent epimerase/dehydratase family protein [Clostridia bacterium]MDD4686077.1 NAD-dependent epimerase/dehydratase family protein [Clostridia bacterium]